MIILQHVSSSESSSLKSMIIGSMTLLSIKFSLQYSFSILTTCSSAFVHTSFVVFPKPLSCHHINSIGLSSQCPTGFLILHVRVNYQFYLFYKLLGSFFVLFFHIILFWYQQQKKECCVV